MFVKQFFVICLLATSIKAANTVLNATECGYNNWGEHYIHFTQQTVGANDVVVSIISKSPTTCNFSTAIYASFYDSSLAFIPPILFTAIPNIWMFWVERSIIQEIRSNTFQSANKMVSFVFQYGSIQKIAANAFSNSYGLQSIFINFNSTNTIVDTNAFRGAPGRTALNFDSLNITSILKNKFIDNSNLFIIRMKNAQIKYIEPSAIAALKYLEYLWLPYNKLTTLDPNLFQNNSNLKEAVFNDNQLTSLPSTLFQNNAMLQRLDFSNNALTALDKNSFANNKQLQYINLQNNKLNAIYNTTFSGLTNLQTLNLKNNTCINENFHPYNATVVVSALAKCDANAIPVPTCDKYVTAIKNLSGTINSTVAALAKLTQALTQITKI
jgi:hypothetical protein